MQGRILRLESRILRLDSRDPILESRVLCLESRDPLLENRHLILHILAYAAIPRLEIVAPLHALLVAPVRMVAGFLLEAVLALHRLAADPAAELLGLLAAAHDLGLHPLERLAVLLAPRDGQQQQKRRQQRRHLLARAAGARGCAEGEGEGN